MQQTSWASLVPHIIHHTLPGFYLDKKVWRGNTARELAGLKDPPEEGVGTEGECALHANNWEAKEYIPLLYTT